jgi:hypothetical protein
MNLLNKFVIITYYIIIIIIIKYLLQKTKFLTCKIYIPSITLKITAEISCK